MILDEGIFKIPSFYFKYAFVAILYTTIFAARLKILGYTMESSFKTGTLPKRFDKGPPVGNASRVK
jgi:hypothetical protein